MPQMMPMNWVLLFIFFVIMFFIMNSLNYHSKIEIISNSKTHIFKNKINWKW